MLRTNVLQGEVHRSWVWLSPAGAKHVIDLWHDTVTGVRSVAVGMEEVPGSMGSSPFFSAEAHHINFTVGQDQCRGMVIIEKAGLFSFRYTCVVNGRPLKATLQGLADEDEERFNIAILGAANAYSSKEKSVTWYELTVTRGSDGARTLVHRRYREFVCLFEQVHAAFKGHHLRSSLPELPGRQLKLLVDHNDTAFVEERRLLLETALGKLLSVPHVGAMVPVQVFLGFFDRLKEHSVIFTQRDLGLSITRTVVPEESIVVTRVKEAGPGGQKSRVMVGDTLSKVGGEPVSKFGGFDGVAFQVSRGLRPIVIHFLEPVDRNPSHDFLPPGEPLDIPPVHEQQRQRKAAAPHAQSPVAPPPVVPTPSGLPTRLAATTSVALGEEASGAPTTPPVALPAQSKPPVAALPRVEIRVPSRGPASRPRPKLGPSEDEVEHLKIERISSKREGQDPNKLQSVLEAALVEEERRSEGQLNGSLSTSLSSAGVGEPKDPLFELETSGRGASEMGSTTENKVAKGQATVPTATQDNETEGEGSGAENPAAPIQASESSSGDTLAEEGPDSDALSHDPSEPLAALALDTQELGEQENAEDGPGVTVEEPHSPVSAPPPVAPAPPALPSYEPPPSIPAAQPASVSLIISSTSSSVPSSTSHDPPPSTSAVSLAPASTLRSLSPPLPVIFPTSSPPTTTHPVRAVCEAEEMAAADVTSKISHLTDQRHATEDTLGGGASRVGKDEAIGAGPIDLTAPADVDAHTSQTSGVHSQSHDSPPSVVAHSHDHLSPRQLHHDSRLKTPPRLEKAKLEEEGDVAGGAETKEELVPPSPFEDYM
ncbi:px domain containing protein [Nannochloropsis gaditana CCMP526]|uniref:px domain containing protein n=1 Tax=Nannochloropsis gaditana (strain CCMP526) TaxID=1093141 RepID=UPI00029F6014|nr:px domain containing protein [Nannochloropsis gaditana CCMP526]EKU22566.1 px domain containing protein [Nannochloropsis gaditana CCMP526]|eukprot:XP_005853793.1 px domain containing protein [Nannochloropsis gaditana CCMP526]